MSDKCNFEEKLDKLEKTLNIWRSRDLTILGRINIVKSLALSKLIHVASVLPFPEGFTQKVNTLIYNFIWKDKPPKIKKSTIIGERKAGGLKAPDFIEVNKALKLVWIKRFFSETNATWQIIPSDVLDRYGGALLLNSQYSIKLLELTNLPPFYVQVLQFWQEIRNYTTAEINVQQILKEVIWNNRRIQVNQKSIFYHDWYTKGIITIRDIVDDNNIFLTFSSVKEKFSIETSLYTKYYGIISAIPQEWKKILNSPQAHSNQLPKQWFENPLAVTTKRAYRELIKHKFIAPTSQEKIINQGIKPELLSKLYILPYRSTRESKLIAFQLKIIHNILPTNTVLYKMKIKDSEQCPYCANKKQSMSHLFIDCDLASTFWKTFKTWWKNKTKQEIHLLAAQILYGILKSSENRNLINHLLIIAKYYIFSSYVRNEHFTFVGFLRETYNRYKLENEIAIKHQKQDVFNKKWNVIFQEHRSHLIT